MTDITSEVKVVAEKKSRYKTKSPSRGGARKGAGRPKGSVNKVQYTDLLDEVHKATGKNFAELIADEINKSIVAGDTRLTKDYLDMIGKKAIADKSETDITSNGETIQGSFVFVPTESPDWTNVK